MCLYNENFQKKAAIDEELLSGAISSIETFLDEAMKDAQKLEVISQKEDVFIFEHGDQVIGVLVVEKEYNIFKYLLKKFVMQFENYFQSALQEWSGNIDLFKPSKNLVNEIFTTL
ncbi:MAG: hypothetical protein ACXQS8_03030 [Candidatus Helarchaeales archaeon]